jgi:cell division protein FtsW
VTRAHQPYDQWLLIVVLLLTAFGALMVYSSTAVITPVMEKKQVAEFHYFKKHLFSVAIGLLVLFAASRVSLRFLERAAVPLLAASFLLLVLVFVPGVGIEGGGARRWIHLWPTTFQPSELVKLAMVVFLARYMSGVGYRKDSFVSFVVPVVLMAVFQLVFMKQPDFGSAMSLAALTLFMLYLSGAKLRYILFLLLLGMPVLVKLLMTPYRLKRVLTFLDPWSHQFDSGFQLVQSFIALGRGGFFGVGLGQSRQKLDFLPEVHTDFIFSMVGEELGFLAAAVIVVLFAFIFFRGIRIASGTTDPFSYYLASGLSMLLALQSLVNFCVVTGMLPTKGLPLPFLSYGGSALLINMAAAGMLLNLSRPCREQRVERNELREIMRRKKARRAVYGSISL